MPEEIFFLEEISGDDINPYEAVKMASIEARRVNQARLMVGLAEVLEKPTTLALRRLSEKKLRLAYEGRVVRRAEEETHDTPGRETGAVGS